MLPSLGALRPLPRLTLLGRAIVLISGELVFNAVCWVIAALVLNQADGLLGLALLAWVCLLCSDSLASQDGLETDLLDDWVEAWYVPRRRAACMAQKLA
jgi:hypothetical protein